MTDNRYSARKEAFALVPETCPKVDNALEEAARSIKNQTEALREALINALERALEAEARADDLEQKVEDLQEEVERLEAEMEASSADAA